MGDSHFLVNVGVAILAALVGGLVARALKLPLLIGYLIAGVVVGPHTPGVTANQEAVHGVASLGAALLMFAVGTHLSLQELRAVRRIALIGGVAQITGTVLLGFLVGLALGWGVYGGLFLGCALALSSTAVMMRLLEERGELGSAHGRALLAVLVVQDLATVIMVTLLPSLASLQSGGAGALAGVALSLLKAAVSVTVTLLLAMQGVPKLLEYVARKGSPELFLLTVVSVCLVAGYAAQLAGLSLELGAFLAGVVISESEYAHEVFSQIRPLRDLFAALFFVSVGMLLDPGFLLRHWLPVLAVVLTIVVGKAVIGGLSVFAAGVHGRTALLTGLGLAQIGEFSFVLASIGDRRGLISPELSSVILAAALITILLTPFVFGAGGPLYDRLNASPVLSRWLNRAPDQVLDLPPPAEEDGARVLILGGGRVGRYVSDALRAMRVPHLVVDYDGDAARRLQEQGVPVLYGDATSEVVLHEAHPERAELAIVTLPQAPMTLTAIHVLKRLAPELPIVVRVHRGIDIPAAREAGAEAVIHAEFEAGTEIIRQGLDRLGIPDWDVDAYLGRVREVRYREAS